MTDAFVDRSGDGNASHAFGSRERLARLREAGCALLTLAISGNPAISFGYPEVLFVGLALAFYAPRVIVNRCWGIKHFAVACSWFLMIFLIQGYSFSFFPIGTILGFLLRVFIGFSFISTLRNPLRAYVDSMCLLVTLSLAFYLPHQLGMVFGYDIKEAFSFIRQSLPQADHFHILIHNFNNLENEHRNSGMFWEPGAFAGYLILGLIFSLLLRTRPPGERPLRWSFLWLIVGLLSTQSTTGFLMIPFLLALRSYPRLFQAAPPRVVLLRIFGTALMLILVAWGLFKIPWVGQKFLEQIQASTQEQGGWAITRFGSLLFDLQYIELRPLTGWGLHSTTRYMLHPYLAEALGNGQGNGLSGFLAKVGILGFGFFGVRCFTGLRRISGSIGRSSIAMGIIVLTLFGESFLNFPMFLSLMFLPLVAYPMTAKPSLDSRT